MSNIFLSFARQSREANRAVVTILDKLSNEEREKERGSYYGSLSGLFRHEVGSFGFFQTIFQEPLTGNAAAGKALAVLAGVKFPKGTLTADQWKEIATTGAAVDDAFVDLVSAISEEELQKQIKWFDGTIVPLSFVLQALTLHGAHHRGQISQILDELKIDNDYSGINSEFLK
ncbi:hypothetical protein FACS1894164_21140 [Spirochaetia bacterium]|nr:hypothetical protein FACS1894164_21140 [Spirochaetia bacterium]